jgi:hypothetical protein
MVARAKSRLGSAGYHHFLRRGPVAQFGSALEWHSRGQGFDSPPVHQIFEYKIGKLPSG